MLDAFIIEELRRRERDEQQERERPVLELPLDDGVERAPTGRDEDREDSDRGVIRIDF